MKKSMILGLLTALPVAGFAGSSEETTKNDMSQNTQAQLLVKFEDNLTQEQITRINTRLGATVVDTLSNGRLYVVELAYANTSTQIMNAYAATDGVVFVEPNSTISIPELETVPSNEDAPLIPMPKIED